MGFLLAAIGWFIGEFIIAGILYAVFVPVYKPPETSAGPITWLGRIIGIVLMLAIFL